MAVHTDLFIGPGHSRLVRSFDQVADN